MRPRVLVLGGLDPTGGAGITADARVLELHDCHALTVATCLTVQNRHGFVRAEAVAVDLFLATLRAALQDGPVHAVKLGLAPDAATLGRAAEVLATLRVPTVLDPVLSATAGGWSSPGDLARAQASTAAALAAVVTPNLPELEQLAPDGGAAALLARGCAAVVVKGGHGAGAEVEDLIHTPGRVDVVRHVRASCGAVHGTGCALASATVAGLAHGRDVVAAASAAARWVGDCLRAMPPPVDDLPRPFVPRRPS